jgi:hypothetical protein
MSDTASVSELDRVVEVVRAALAPYGPEAASVEVGPWHSPDTWIVEVEAAREGCAEVSIGGAPDDALSVTFGHTSFECFPVNEDTLAELREILDSVFAGRFEESGHDLRAFARVFTRSGVVGIGHIHWPAPWRWRRVRRYLPYGVSG